MTSGADVARTWRRIAAVCALSSLLILAGCWDTSNPQDVNFATAIGIDRRNGEIELFIQFLDFRSVAKSESEQGPGKVWMSSSTGKTIGEAVNKLYLTGQRKTFFGQTTAIVIHERVIRDQRLKGLLDLMNRFRELRHNMWIYSTKESLEDLFNTTVQFEGSPRGTTMHEPLSNLAQAPHLIPVRILKLMARLDDPGYGLYVPNLSIDKTTWEADRTYTAVPFISGATFLAHDGKLLGYLDNEQVSGLRYLQSETEGMTIQLMRKGEALALARLESVTNKIQAVQQNDGTFRYNIFVEASMNLRQLNQPIDEAELLRVAETKVAEEIRQTYTNGLEIKADVLKLCNSQYRRSKIYKKFDPNVCFSSLDESSILSIDVDIKLVSSGKYKLRYS